MRRWIQLLVLLHYLLLAGVNPAIAQQESGYAFITNQLDDSVSVIAIPSGNLRKTIHNISKPAPISICGDVAIVTSADAHQLTFIQLATLETETIDFATGPFGIDCDEETAYIGDWFTHQVYFLSLKTHQIEKRVDVGHAPAGVLLNKTSEQLYIANRDDDSLSVIDLQSHEIFATLATGDAPYGLSYNPHKNQLYVINVRSDDVTVIDTKTLTILDKWDVGQLPYCGVVSKDGKYLYVTNQEDNTLSMIDTDDGATLKTISIGEVPEGVNITDDQRYLVSVGWESGVIDIIDRSNLEVVRQVKAGKGSRSFGRFIALIDQ